MEDRVVKCLLIDESSQERKRLEKLLKHIENVETIGSMGSSNEVIFFVEKLSMQMSNSSYEFIYTVNKISVPTRYPEDLRKLFEAYTKKRTEEILNQTKKTQSWIKLQ